MKHFPEWSLRATKLLASVSAVVLLLASSQAALIEAGVFSGGETSPEEARPQPPDPKRLEVIEELSESLANDLLDLSLATRDHAHHLIAEFFPDELQATPFPSYPLQVQRQLKWIGRHGWTSDALAAAARHSQTPTAQADRSGSVPVTSRV